MEIKLPQPPMATGVPIFGNRISETEFQGVMPHGLFREKVPDPRKLEGVQAKYHQELAPVADLRQRVQRLIAGAKKQNIAPYGEYIAQGARTGRGFTPQIVLWCPEQLDVQTDPTTGLAFAVIPHSVRFVALDGDTQTTARHWADSQWPGLLDKTFEKVVICHGITEEEAQNIFADCNTKGVKVSTSMAIGLDNRDEITLLAKRLETRVPMLHGQVNRQKRQLSTKDAEVITISALRASVVCFAEGIGGVQNQTKDIEVDPKRLAVLDEAAVHWYQAACDALNGALTPEQRANTFASAPSVWSALGALGNDALVDLVGPNFDKPVTSAALEHGLQAAAQKKLANVNWTRGDHWLNVGAKKTAAGAITLGGPKETGSLVYKGLKDGTLLNVEAAAA